MKGGAKSVLLQDSGERRQFDTGAVRDISEGKGRCDLLPLDVVGALLEDEVLKNLDQFMRDTTNFSFALYNAVKAFCKKREWDYSTAMLEVSKHFEDGAVKYGDNNWRRGIPLHCYIDSAVRHLPERRSQNGSRLPP